MIDVYPPPKLTDQERLIIVTSFPPIYQDQIIENNTKQFMNHILKLWNENKSSAHPITHEMTSAEVVSLKVYYIEIK